MIDQSSHMDTPRVSGYLILLNYFTPGYITMGILVLLFFNWSMIAQGVFVLAWLYLLPPILCRLTLWVAGSPEIMDAKQDHKAYKVWWLLTQYQMIFNRFMFLEEILRLLPGVYALWLNLWGSQVSVYTLWSPQVLVFDRYLLTVGRDTVLGTGSFISAHLASKNERGEYILSVSPVTIGKNVMIGAQSAIGPGCIIDDNQTLPGKKVLTPFSRWQAGKKISVSDARP